MHVYARALSVAENAIKVNDAFYSCLLLTCSHCRGIERYSCRTKYLSPTCQTRCLSYTREVCQRLGTLSKIVLVRTKCPSARLLQVEEYHVTEAA